MVANRVGPGISAPERLIVKPMTSISKTSNIIPTNIIYNINVCSCRIRKDDTKKDGY
jgi:hypothetical protein